MTGDTKRILVIDDDMHMRESVSEVLRRKGYDLMSCSNGYEAVACFKNSSFDCVISDIKMPGMSGIDLLEKIKQHDAAVPFILMTAYGDIEIAVNAMKKGAYDFIEKGTNLLDRLEFSLERALAHMSLLQENVQLKRALKKQWDYIGKTENIEQIRQLVHTIAPSRSTVLVCGESGTGKELIARSIHYLSPRQHGPFIKINCAALPEGLIESELFGHEKGAFTGALKTRTGKFEQASGGTLLLDEIGEMSMNVQAKLLRVLQEREVDKVGGDEPVTVDVRIVVTTNRDLGAEVKKGNFREDLFYRLNVFRIYLPPLRERIEDISLLTDHFINKYNKENGLNVSGMETDAKELLHNYQWPGNIRELENTIERAVVLTKNGTISADTIHMHPMTDNNSHDHITPGVTVSEMEKRLILATLDFCHQNRTKAADMLGISIRTLRNKLHEYNCVKTNADIPDEKEFAHES